jgi:type II secretory pathway component PulF
MVHPIGRDILYPLSMALDDMSASVSSGTPLVTAIELAAERTKEPRIRDILDAMKASWFKEQTILPPLEQSRELIPRAIYWLSAAGFLSGLLDVLWPRAVAILRDRLKPLPHTLTQHQMRFVFELGTLLSAGVTLESALDAMADDSDDTFWQANVVEIKDGIAKGKELPEVLQESTTNLLRREWLPRLAERYKAGTIDKAFLELAEQCRNELPDKK